MQRATFLGALVACTIMLTPGAEAKWGRAGSEVRDLKKASDIDRITESPYVWIVALYRDGCGYCELLKPEWEKSAGKMRKMVGFAAIDVVKHPKAAEAIQSQYNFQVKGVPTIVVFKPKPDGSRPERIIYEYERKSKAIVNYLSEMMPDYVARVTSGSYPTWEAKPGAKLVLFSKKKTSPSSIKALSTKYRQRMSFGFVDEDDKKLAAKFGVTSYPALFVVEKGKAIGVGAYEPLVYKKDATTLTAIEFFIMDHMLPKPEEVGQETVKKKDRKSSSSGSKEKAKGKNNKEKEKGKNSKEKDSKAKQAGGSKKGADGNNTAGSNEDEAGKKEKKEKKEKEKKEKREKEKEKKKLSPEEEDRAKKKKEKKDARKKAKEDALKAARGKTVKTGLRKLDQPADPYVLKNTDLSKLSVKDLRGVLARWDDECRGCAEKDNFLMKIKSNRKVYGDMEHVASAYKKAAQDDRKREKAKAKSAKRKAAKEGNFQSGGSSSSSSSSRGGGGSEGGKLVYAGEEASSEDDPFCSRMLALETEPLHEKIAQLEYENAALRLDLEHMNEELIIEDGDEEVHEEL